MLKRKHQKSAPQPNNRRRNLTIRALFAICVFAFVSLSSTLAAADEVADNNNINDKVIDNNHFNNDIGNDKHESIVARRNDPPWAVFITCAVSHVTIAPTLALLWRRRWLFELCTCLGSLICSFMYHSCQAFNGSFFLSELQWHVLDNIFVICNFGNLFVYWSIFRDARVDFLLKASAMFVALTTQIRAPWEISHTVVPVAMYAAIPIIRLIYGAIVGVSGYNKYNNSGLMSPSIVLGGGPSFSAGGGVTSVFSQYDLKPSIVGCSLLAIAVPFFALGLDDDHDPFRLFHGLWHCFVGVAAFYMWRMVKFPIATNVQYAMFGENGSGPFGAGKALRSEV